MNVLLRRGLPLWAWIAIVLGTLVLIATGVAFGWRSVGLRAWEAALAEARAEGLRSVPEIRDALPEVDRKVQQDWADFVDRHSYASGPLAFDDLDAVDWQRTDLLAWRSAPRGAVPVDVAALLSACQPEVDEALGLLRAGALPDVRGSLQLQAATDLPWELRTSNLMLARYLACCLRIAAQQAEDPSTATAQLDLLAEAHGEPMLLIDLMIAIVLRRAAAANRYDQVRFRDADPQRMLAEWPVPFDRGDLVGALRSDYELFTLPFCQGLIEGSLDLDEVGIRDGFLSAPLRWMIFPGQAAAGLAHHQEVLRHLSAPTVHPLPPRPDRSAFGLMGLILPHTLESEITLAEHNASLHAQHLAIRIEADRRRGLEPPADRAELLARFPDCLAADDLRLALAYECDAEGYRFIVDPATPVPVPSAAGRYASLRRVLVDSASPLELP